jgi:hypothetical protein
MHRYSCKSETKNLIYVLLHAYNILRLERYVMLSTAGGIIMNVSPHHTGTGPLLRPSVIIRIIGKIITPLSFSVDPLVISLTSPGHFAVIPRAFPVDSPMNLCSFPVDLPHILRPYPHRISLYFPGHSPSIPRSFSVVTLGLIPRQFPAHSSSIPR